MARKLQIRGERETLAGYGRIWEEVALFSLSGDNGVDTSEGRESTTGERIAGQDRKIEDCNAH